MDSSSTAVSSLRRFAMDFTEDDFPQQCSKRLLLSPLKVSGFALSVLTVDTVLTSDVPLDV